MVARCSSWLCIGIARGNVVGREPLRSNSLAVRESAAAHRSKTSDEYDEIVSPCISPDSVEGAFHAKLRSLFEEERGPLVRSVRVSGHRRRRSFVRGSQPSIELVVVEHRHTLMG